MKQSISIDCSSASVSQALREMRHILEKSVPGSMLRPLVLGVDELVQNSFEHGCLNITYEEKRAAVNADTFERLIVERCSQERAKDQQIDVNISVEAQCLRIIITDSGEGFDWKKVTEGLKESAANDETSGRGLAIAIASFDELYFNKKGNEVTAIKSW